MPGDLIAHTNELMYVEIINHGHPEMNGGMHQTQTKCRRSRTAKSQQNKKKKRLMG